MNALGRCVIAGCLVLAPVLAQAQPGQLKLVFDNGTVTVDAEAIPLRAILDAWATLGGTRIDGIDRLVDADITLHAEALPEDEALAALLKGRNAFATVPRKPADAGASRIARIALFGTARAAAGSPRSSVPADWPFPVNTEHPDDVDREPPTTEVKVERPGIEIPWPLPIDETIAVDAPPATGVLERPGIDIPWPFPVNHEPTLELPPPVEAVVPAAIPGVDVAWPFPVNPNPVDPDSAAPVAEPAAAVPPREQAPTDPAASETPTAETKKPATKAKGAPVSTKAPKPIPPRKPPQQRDR
jgi:hypothetical protein